MICFVAVFIWHKSALVIWRNIFGWIRVHSPPFYSRLFHRNVLPPLKRMPSRFICRFLFSVFFQAIKFYFISNPCSWNTIIASVPITRCRPLLVTFATSFPVEPSPRLSFHRFPHFPSLSNHFASHLPPFHSTQSQCNVASGDFISQ